MPKATGADFVRDARMHQIRPELFEKRNNQLGRIHAIVLHGDQSDGHNDTGCNLQIQILRARSIRDCDDERL